MDDDQGHSQKRLELADTTTDRQHSRRRWAYALLLAPLAITLLAIGFMERWHCAIADQLAGDEIPATPPSGEEIPVYPGALIIQEAGNKTNLVFETTAMPIQVAAFYRRYFAAEGWKEGVNPRVGGTELLFGEGLAPDMIFYREIANNPAMPRHREGSVAGIRLARLPACGATRVEFAAFYYEMKEMPEAQRFRHAVEAVCLAMPKMESIVATSIVSALAGEYGDYHRTSRTSGSELWINPLMPVYWCFQLRQVAQRLLYRRELEHTTTREEVHQAIVEFRERCPSIRPRRHIPA